MSTDEKELGPAELVGMYAKLSRDALSMAEAIERVRALHGKQKHLNLCRTCDPETQDSDWPCATIRALVLEP